MVVRALTGGRLRSFQQEKKKDRGRREEGGGDVQTQSVMQDYSVSFSTAGDVFFYEGGKKNTGLF